MYLYLPIIKRYVIQVSRFSYVISKRKPVRLSELPVNWANMECYTKGQRKLSCTLPDLAHGMTVKMYFNVLHRIQEVPSES
jgi:hypothetical protein